MMRMIRCGHGGLSGEVAADADIAMQKTVHDPAPQHP